MKINQLTDNTFCNFASQTIGVDVKLYKDDLEIKRTEKGVKLKVYLGGEKDDERKFYFQDTKCYFVGGAHSSTKKDISYQWINYILACEELTEEDKQAIVIEYNANLESEINNFAMQKREELINL